MATLSRWYGRLLDALLLLACLLLLTMTLLIGADVLSRNVGLGGIAPSNELSEDIIYLVTLLAAPGLLRQGQHIRVDILLRVLPDTIAWLLEWLGDILGMICCLYFVWYGTRVAVASFASGALSIKTLIMPEWWLLAPMPVAFVLLGVENASAARRWLARRTGGSSPSTYRGSSSLCTRGRARPIPRRSRTTRSAIPARSTPSSTPISVRGSPTRTL